MNKTFNIYCDESTHLENDGMPFFMLAYISVAYNQMKVHKESIKAIRARHKAKGEVKWAKACEGNYHYYADLIDYFFSSDINFRAVIVDKRQIDKTRDDYNFSEFYFKMYYQLLHHKMNLEHNFNVYLDIKDTRSHKKLHKLKDILKWNTSIRSFQFIHSHESSFMQLADLIMGAINYKLRGENKVTAKNKLIEKIEAHCKRPITQTTPKADGKFNLFFIDLKN